jgi:hypothetical protein
MPDTATPLIPLLWIRGEPEDVIRRAVREVAESGNTGFILESRPHPEHGREPWWTDLRVVIDEARRRGLEVWLFDDKNFPSGKASGRVMDENPELHAHVLLEQSITVQGPLEAKEWRLPQPLGDNEGIIGAMAFKPGEGPVALDCDAESGAVLWAPPEGEWHLCWCIDRLQRGGSRSDVLNPATAEAFIRHIHEPTYRELGDDFGLTIKGFFSDEAGISSDWVQHKQLGKPGETLAWSPVLPGYFRQLKGYDLCEWLPALWYDLGPRTRKVRHDYMEACSRAFSEHFFRPQCEWCRDHGVRLVGHVVEDNLLNHALAGGPGHWFWAMEQFDMPGIDIIGYQVTPGLDSGSVLWQVRWPEKFEVAFFQFALPAMARGAGLMRGGREIFAEVFGAYGWAEGLRMAGWISDWLLVNGITVISPHAFTMAAGDRSCPPCFNRLSGNPQWRHYREWALPFRRIQRVIADTEPCYDAAVLYTAESLWTGKGDAPDDAVQTLELNQVSTVVLPYDALNAEWGVAEGRWRFRGQSFSAIVLPFVQYVPAMVVERLAAIAEAGVSVFVLGPWPQGAVDPAEDAAVAAALARLRSAPTARLATHWELSGQFRQRTVHVDPAPVSLVCSRRRDADGHEWLLLHNRSLTATVQGSVRVRTGHLHAARFEPQDGSYCAVSHGRKGEDLVMDVEIPPYGLWCLRLSGSLPPVRPVAKWTEGPAVIGPWEASKALDDAASDFAPALRVDRLGSWLLWEGMADYAGTVRYRAQLQRPAHTGQVGLDAGAVEETAELRVNGCSVGACLHPPYRWDITDALREGSNVIEIDVTNTARARWDDRYSKSEATGGLLGPVRLLLGARE